MLIKGQGFFSTKFSKQLRKCSTSIGDVFHFYTAVIRAVLKYACPVYYIYSVITNERYAYCRGYIANVLMKAYTEFCIHNNLKSHYIYIYSSQRTKRLQANKRVI